MLAGGIFELVTTDSNLLILSGTVSAVRSIVRGPSNLRIRIENQQLREVETLQEQFQQDPSSLLTDKII